MVSLLLAACARRFVTVGSRRRHGAAVPIGTKKMVDNLVAPTSLSAWLHRAAYRAKNIPAFTKRKKANATGYVRADIARNFVASLFSKSRYDEQTALENSWLCVDLNAGGMPKIWLQRRVPRKDVATHKMSRKIDPLRVEYRAKSACNHPGASRTAGKPTSTLADPQSVCAMI